MDILLFLILIDILENSSVDELEHYKNHDMKAVNKKVLSEGMDLKTVYESDKCMRELIDMFIEQKRGEH